ncbi:MAG: GNAT family N-acetyltransferase [Desulfobacula sp.]|nr:GNAT family N-acetyltransferase [Desulfobacula sp.]
MEIELKRFKKLGVDELYELLKLRVDVFVVEQNCPYPEIDEKDRHPDALHLLYRNQKSGKITAYLRILPPGLSFKEASFGRLAVAKEHRGEGISRVMVNKAVQVIENTWPENNIRIGAQLYLKHFYESHDFNSISSKYLEDGIEHIDMLRKVS